MNKIKIGAVAWGLPGGGIYAPRIAKAAGLDGIQLELGSYREGYPLLQPEVMDGYLEDGKRYGIEYPALVLNDVMKHEFIHGRGTANGKIAYEQIELGIRAAAKMGIGRIMIPNFLNNLITRPEHIEHTQEALRYACRLAAEEGILILTENALPWKEQKQLLEAVGEPNLKVHFDTQNFKYNFGMEQCGELAGLYPLMDDMIHVKDGVNAPGERLLGEGNTDFFGQMKLLRAKGFQGYIVIENYYNGLPLCFQAGRGGQMELLRRDVETVQGCF